MSHDVKQKPPLGIEPEAKWKRRRIIELNNAIARGVEADYLSPATVGWCEQLTRLIAQRVEGNR